MRCYLLSRRHLFCAIAGSQLCFVLLFIFFNPFGNSTDISEDAFTKGRRHKILTRRWTHHRSQTLNGNVLPSLPSTTISVPSIFAKFTIKSTPLVRDNRSASLLRHKQCFADICIPEYPILRAQPFDFGATRTDNHDDAPRYFWSSVRTWPSAGHLYSEHNDVDNVLRLLATGRIVMAESFSPEEHQLRRNSETSKITDYGSTPKWLLTLNGGQRVVFKPKWYPRNHTKDQWYLGYELHTSEIAAFHLDRILGFRRFPFTVGRRIQVAREILPVASQVLLKSLNHGAGREICLRARCYMCSRSHTACSQNGYMEGSVSFYVPALSPASSHPWDIQNYHRHIKYGLDNRGHCAQVLRLAPPYDRPAIFLDLVDAAVLDYISFHFDSKVYFHFPAEGGPMIVNIDRGRSIRRSTWQKLMSLQNKNLSTLLRLSLERDPISPPSIINLENYAAVDRRLGYIIAVVRKCISSHGEKNVVIHDHYTSRRQKSFD